MPAKSSATQYGSVAVTLHWISALLIVAAVGSGFFAAGMDSSLTKADILKLHVPLGIAIFGLTLVRIGWWMFVDKKPSPVPMPSWQKRSSGAVHFLFYVVIFTMTVSGMGMMMLSGASSIIFGGELAQLPEFRDYLPRKPHGIGARLIIALIVIHAGGALYHYRFKKDGVLGRMWFAS